MMRTSGVETSFVSSPETERERFLYLSCSLAEGFYQRHGFLIVPKVIPKFYKRCVAVPEELKQASLNYWEDAKAGGSTMPKKLSKLMWQEFEKVHFQPVDKVAVKDFEKKWRKVEAGFWQFVRQVFPMECLLVGSLEVRITKIGSLGTHYLLTKKRGQKLIVNIREDGGFEEIGSLILTALIYCLKDNLELSFSKRMVVRDFLMTRPEMKKMFSGWKQDSHETIKIPEELRKESLKYLDFLGVPRLTDPMEIINKNWPVFGKKEAKFLRLLIKNTGEMVSYDQIADEIWGLGEFKTYWAINKIYQRTQKKINELGAAVKIEGFRGRGYKFE